jgi:GNAT superfamily N-acetyltransferase
MSNVRALVPLEAVAVEPLALHPEALPELCRLFEAEWPTWYGIGGPGNATEDLVACSATSGLPFGLVALQRGEVCGVAALKAESIPSHRHLSPWAAAGLVKGPLRGRGIGAALLAALEELARSQGYRAIHCATSTSESLLQRRDYRLLERVVHEGQDLGVYQRGL